VAPEISKNGKCCQVNFPDSYLCPEGMHSEKIEKKQSTAAVISSTDKKIQLKKAKQTIPLSSAYSLRHQAAQNH